MGYIKDLKTFSLNEDELRVNPSTAGEELGMLLAANKEVKEVGDNRGEEVEKYLKSVGLEPGNPWCMSFVYYIFDELAKKMGKSNPLPKTGGVQDHWKKGDTSLKILGKDAAKDPSLVKPGQIFFLDTGGGRGHTGIVISVDPANGTYTAIEGNSNSSGGREGKEVSVNKRKVSASNLLGFIDYFKNSRTPEFETDLAKNLELSPSTISRIAKSTGASAPVPTESDAPASLATNLLTGLVRSLNQSSASASTISSSEVGRALKALGGDKDKEED